MKKKKACFPFFCFSLSFFALFPWERKKRNSILLLPDPRYQISSRFPLIIVPDENQTTEPDLRDIKQTWPTWFPLAIEFPPVQRTAKKSQMAFFVYSCCSTSPARALRLASIRSCRLSRRALFLARLASISSLSMRSRALSALAFWICKWKSSVSASTVYSPCSRHPCISLKTRRERLTCSMRARLCLKVLPLLRW